MYHIRLCTNQEILNVATKGTYDYIALTLCFANISNAKLMLVNFNAQI